MPLQRILEEPQLSGFFPFLGNAALQDFFVAIDRTPLPRLADSALF